jgi:succinoglycan biosynthesis transport protein ExoP
MKQREQLARYRDATPLNIYRAATEERLFGWEQALRVLRKNLRFIVSFAGILIASIALAAFLMRDTFQPTARVQIDPPNNEISTLQEIEGTKISNNQDYLETQAQILQSEGLAIRVIRLLRLDRNPEFVSKGELARFGKAEGQTARTNSGGAGESGFLQEQAALADQTPLESIALGVLQKRLSVTPVRNSRLIEVSYASHDPEVAQLVTNTLIAQFIEQSFHDRYRSTTESSGWLSTKLDEMRRKVEESNQAVADYQRRFGLVESDDHDVPLAQLMSEVNHQLSEAQANRIESEAYVRMIDLGQSEAIPAVRDNPLYQNLMTHLADVRAQLAQTKAIYGDENSNVKKLEGESNELAAQVEAERSRMVSRVRTSFGAAQAREQMMLGTREKLRGQMGDASSHLVAYRMLKNEAVANAQLYNTLQGRLKEAGIYAGLRTSNIHVVNLAAKLRKATTPHRGLIVGAGAVVSCMLTLILAFVRESFDNTVRTPDDIKEWIGLPSLALIPSGNSGDRKYRSKEGIAELKLSDNERPAGMAGDSSKITWNQTRMAEAEAMRDLRTALHFSKAGVTPRVILVASGSAGEGRTSVATSLALTFAKNGKTCLMDADLRQPMAARDSGANGRRGLSDVLNGGVALDSALASAPGTTKLKVLNSGTCATNPGDLIASERMQVVVAALREDFEYVVIDSPPVISFSDARVLSTYSDAVVLVGRYGCTTRRGITRCAELLDEVGAPIVGVALNDIDPASDDFHYYNFGYKLSLHGKIQGPTIEKAEFVPAVPQPDPVKKKSTHA